MSPTRLHLARELALPSRDVMLRRDPSVQRFWESNAGLLAEAWGEWNDSERSGSARLDDTLFDPTMRGAVDRAWDDPSTESAVAELWDEILPGVFAAQFFDAARLVDLRQFMAEIEGAAIPVRPPYGIVLNRGGAMLDERSSGYLAAPEFQAFYQLMMDRYMRPISRLLLPEIVGYDSQTFGFSIRYQPTTDTSIRPHTDASAVTLNINLNLPDEEYEGSVVQFIDQSTGSVADYTFAPGTAVLHRGSVPHVAHPITSGSRSNFVLWLYGNGGRTPPPGTHHTETNPEQRWTVPTDAPDRFAPF